MRRDRVVFEVACPLTIITRDVSHAASFQLHVVNKFIEQRAAKSFCQFVFHVDTFKRLQSNAILEVNGKIGSLQNLCIESFVKAGDLRAVVALKHSIGL